MATFTFTQSVTIGGTNSYSWDSPTNWVGGTLPSAGSSIVLNAVEPGVIYDDLSLHDVFGLAFSHTSTNPLLEIGSGTTLGVTGALGVANSGTIDVNGGAVLTTTTLVNTGIIGLEGTNAVVELPDFKNTGTIAYSSKDASVFLSTPTLSAVYSNTVAGFDVDDKIYLHGTGFTSSIFTRYAAVVTGGHELEVKGIKSNGTIIDLYNLTNFGTAGDLTSINAFVAQVADPSSGTIKKYLELDGVCFAAGTRIAIETGECAVEDLRPGDLVTTVASGKHILRPVRWIGERSIDPAVHPRPESLYPIRIHRGAFADELPRRDLLVSPNHCLFVDRQLVPAKLLVNGLTIVQDRSVRAIHYYHVELDCHDVLLAEGVPAESYLDTENRVFFANANGPTILHPDLDFGPGLAAWQDRLCAPLRLRSVEVDPIWQRLADRGKKFGRLAPSVATTTDRDLRLLVGERTLRPVAQSQNRFVFVALMGSSDIRILSRSAVPVELNRHADDWRRLGVAVKKIVLRKGSEQIDIPPDHPALTQGWHPAESDEATAWRWTNGDGLLPLAPTWRDGPLTIEVHLGCRIAYPMDDEAAARQIA